MSSAPARSRGRLLSTLVVLILLTLCTGCSWLSGSKTTDMYASPDRQEKSWYASWFGPKEEQPEAPRVMGEWMDGERPRFSQDTGARKWR